MVGGNIGMATQLAVCELGQREAITSASSQTLVYCLSRHCAIDPRVPHPILPIPVQSRKSGHLSQTPLVHLSPLFASSTSKVGLGSSLAHSSRASRSSGWYWKVKVYSSAEEVC